MYKGAILDQARDSADLPSIELGLATPSPPSGSLLLGKHSGAVPSGTGACQIPRGCQPLRYAATSVIDPVHAEALQDPGVCVDGVPAKVTAHQWPVQ